VQFLVEIDHVKSGVAMMPEAGGAFIKDIILPTIARAEQLAAEKKIVAGGPVVGQIALRFIVEADSLPDVDRLVSSLPLWPLAETRVTPLVALADRRNSVQALMDRLSQQQKP
jgi:muconolactone delta-isomerase